MVASILSVKHGLKHTHEIGRPMEYCTHSAAYASTRFNYNMGESSKSKNFNF